MLVSKNRHPKSKMNSFGLRKEKRKQDEIENRRSQRAFNRQTSLDENYLNLQADMFSLLALSHMIHRKRNK